MNRNKIPQVHLEKRVKVNGQIIRYQNQGQCGAMCSETMTVKGFDKERITCIKCRQHLKMK